MKKENVPKSNTGTRVGIGTGTDAALFVVTKEPAWIGVGAA